MAVPDDGRDSRYGCQFFRGALCVTARCHDAGSGIETMGAADVGARFTVGFGGDAAGVHYDHIGYSRMAFARA